MIFFSNIITSFLSKSSDYAIQLIGPWGVGKTYLYKNTIEEIVSKQEVYNDATKNYKPIYISLFGLKSIEEIQDKIVFELFESKVFKKYRQRYNKSIKVTKNIFKIGLKGFLNFKKIGTNFNTEVRDIGKTVLGSSELFICFDDLERKNSKLDINDFIGYVNSLVDEGIKVLIITNENVILNENDYKVVKEKVIGISINLDLDKDGILDDIVNKRYQPFESYKNFLNQNKELLLHIAKCSGYNYRNLIYAFDNLHEIYSSIIKDIFDVKDDISDEICKKKDILIKLILAFSIEYKNSCINIDNKSDFFNENNDVLGLSRIIATQDGKEYKDTPIDVFCEKYQINQNEYFFFDSIFDYVIKLKNFESGIFKSEFIENFKLIIKDGQLQEQYEIYNKLNFDQVVNYSETEYKGLCDKLLYFAERGYFKPYEIFGIYQRITFLDNVLDYDLGEVTKKLMNGIEKYVDENQIEFNDIKIFNSHSRSEYTKDNSEIKEQGLKLLKLKNDSQLREKCLEEVKKVIDGEIIEIGVNLNNIPTLIDNDFLLLVGSDKFFDLTKDCSNQTFDSLKTLFSMTNASINKTELDKYISLFEEYQKVFEENNNDKLRKYFYNKYLEFIKNI